MKRVVPLLMLALLAGCGEKEDVLEPSGSKQLTLMLDYFPNADHAGIYAAQAGGHFEQAGLDVEIRQPADPAAPIKQVAAGRVDLAVSYEPELLRARDEGVSVVSVGALVQKPLTSIISLPEAKIREPADLKGKTVGVDAPGTSPYFGLAYMLKKNGLSIKDVTVATMSPQAAAQAFVAGQNDAAMTYEPYLSSVRDKPDSGKIIATTLDYPMVMDTFGCTPKFIKENPKAVKAMVDSYFEALEMIKKEPAKSYEIMGADVKQSGEQFAKSAAYLRWQDKAANQQFFNGPIQAFSKESADLLLEVGIIKSIPDVNSLVDTQFIK